MIAACPNCDAKYRVDEAKVGPEGARLRCAKCEAVFRVRAPGSSASAAIAEPVAQPAPPRPAPAPPAEVAAPAPAATSSASADFEPVNEKEYDSARLVLIADPHSEGGKITASAVAAWGLQPMLVHDGVEAMLWTQRALPSVVVLDAALPKMYGFQVCEIIKRNESLRHIKVVLVGAIHNRDRYRRPPSDIYGADQYLEQPDLPDGLKSMLTDHGMPTGGSAPVPQPAPVAAAPEPVVAPAPAAAAPAADDGLASERENAERLARIVVSDIVLYQGEKFEEAIRAGNLLQALDSEIEEGRSFFRQRIDERVRDERDHLMDELMRVARERGMQ